MGLLDRKYKKVVDLYLEKLYNDNVYYMSSPNIGTILKTAATIKRMDLEKALNELGCKDTSKFTQMFMDEVNKMTGQAKQSNDNQQAIHDQCLIKMSKIVESSVPADEKRRQLSQVVQEANRRIKDDFLRADIVSIKAPDYERRINMIESFGLDRSIEERLAALRNAPGARRADAVASEGAEDLMREINKRKASRK